MGNTNKTFVINTMTETKYSELAKKGKILQTQLNIVDDDDRNRTTIPSYDLMNDKIAGTKADLERKITLSVQTIETEIDKKIDDTVSAMTVTLSSAAGEGDIEKVYTIRQGKSDVGTIEIPKDKVITGAHYDVETNKLVLSVANVSTAISIDLSGLIDINDLSGISSDTVSVTASGRTISADINEKSVGAEHLTDGLSSKIALVDTLGDYMRLSTFNDISNDTGLSAANSGNPVQTLSDITSVVNAVSVALSNDYVEKIAAEKERAEAVEAGLAETLNFVSSDYLTSADYESLSTYTETSATEALRLAKEYTDETSVSLCADYTELVNAEKERADGVEKELSGVLNFVSSDYLTNTDKTNLKAYTVACAKQASADAVAEAHKQFVHISGDTINGNVTVSGDFNVKAVYDVNIYSHDNIQLSADNISLNPSVKLYIKGKEFESYLSDHTTVKSLTIQPGVGSISTLVLTTTDSAGTDLSVTCDMQGFVDHANEASAFALDTAKTYTNEEIAKISVHTTINSSELSTVTHDGHTCSALVINVSDSSGNHNITCDFDRLITYINSVSADAVNSSNGYTDNVKSELTNIIAETSAHTEITGFVLSGSYVDNQTHSTPCNVLVIDTKTGDKESRITCDVQDLVISAGYGLSSRIDELNKCTVFEISGDYVFRPELNDVSCTLSSDDRTLSSAINDLRTFVYGISQDTYNFIAKIEKNIEDVKANIETYNKNDVITIQEGNTIKKYKVIIDENGNKQLVEYDREGVFVEKTAIDTTVAPENDEQNNDMPLMAGEGSEPENAEEPNAQLSVIELYGLSVSNMDSRIPSSKLFVNIVEKISSDYTSCDTKIENTLCAVSSDYLKSADYKALSTYTNDKYSQSVKHADNADNAIKDKISADHKAMISGIYEALSPLSSETSDSLDCSALFPVMMNLWNAVSAMWETYNK